VYGGSSLHNTTVDYMVESGIRKEAWGGIEK
jgi:hypothetical protein